MSEPLCPYELGDRLCQWDGKTGPTTCGKTFEDCLEHDNHLEFGGFDSYRNRVKAINQSAWILIQGIAQTFRKRK